MLDLDSDCTRRQKPKRLTPGRAQKWMRRLASAKAVSGPLERSQCTMERVATVVSETGESARDWVAYEDVWYDTGDAD